MRISGLASGMDIEQIVGDMMKARRIPVDKMKQERQTIQWKMEGYREINNKLNTFRNNIFDSVMRASNMLSKKVTSTDDSKVTATALSTTGNLSMRIKNVTQLASAAANSSTAPISTSLEAKIKPAEALGSQSFGEQIQWQDGIVSKKNISVSSTEPISLGETNIIAPHDMIVKMNGKMYDIVTAENTELTDDNVYLNQTDGTLTFKTPPANGTTISTVFMTEAEVESFTGPSKTFQTTGTIDISKVAITGDSKTYLQEDIVTDRTKLTPDNVYVDVATGDIEFLNDQNQVKVNFDSKHRYIKEVVTTYNENSAQKDSFVFTANQTLNDVFTELSRSTVGVSGFYDEFKDKISVTRTETGNHNADVTVDGGYEMKFEGGFFSNVLKISDANETGGENAKFTLNGLETERTSNTFTISGMTISLKEANFTGEVTLSASTDTDKTFDTIKKFVDEYNELLGFVNGKLKEERYRTYKPLTDDEREALSDKEVEKWEEKARSGLLRNDATLRSPFDQMRLDVYSPVNGQLDTVFKQLSSIGITTSRDFMERGKLELDEDKLRAAIEKDPEGVHQLFVADGANFNDKGIARRMRETLDTAITSVAERAGGLKGKVQNQQFTLGRNLNSIEDRISNFERRLQQVEDRYWKQFTAMEKAMQNANTQADSLFNMLNGGQQQ
ncbi:flagellar filament capping protein FliD [Bacillus solitudinis]|uniref:flagellar filament capping protein FliD n=1 Tax=Bacillus solitudinis TaxID=2014074 RepID=UPI000C239938|nr:flagellar filament capping protein FliD [Bacillus solitudinis]